MVKGVTRSLQRDPELEKIRQEDLDRKMKVAIAMVVLAVATICLVALIMSLKGGPSKPTLSHIKNQGGGFRPNMEPYITRRDLWDFFERMRQGR